LSKCGREELTATYKNVKGYEQMGGIDEKLGGGGGGRNIFHT
jgi:hypothetical protein